MKENQYKERLAKANRTIGPGTVISGQRGTIGIHSVLGSQAQGQNAENEEENITIEMIINAEIKNISR